jgi:hypothetical protein
MQYGKLISLKTQKTWQGYYSNPPCPGETFLLSGDADSLSFQTTVVFRVIKIPSQLRKVTLFTQAYPEQSRPGDYFFVTQEESFLLQPYSPPFTNDAA